MDLSLKTHLEVDRSPGQVCSQFNSESRHYLLEANVLAEFFLSDFYSCWYTKNKSKVRKMDQTCYTHPVSGCFGCGVCPLLHCGTLVTSGYNIDLRAVTIVRP